MEARSKLDILYAEVLGDVTNLVTRLEHISAEVQATAARIDQAPELIRSHVLATSQDLAGTLLSASANAHRELDHVTRDLGTNASAMRTAAARIAALSLAIGMTGGLLGGALAGMALANFIY